MAEAGLAVTLSPAAPGSDPIKGGGGETGWINDNINLQQWEKKKKEEKKIVLRTQKKSGRFHCTSRKERLRCLVNNREQSKHLSQGQPSKKKKKKKKKAARLPDAPPPLSSEMGMGAAKAGTRFVLPLVGLSAFIAAW